MENLLKPNESVFFKTDDNGNILGEKQIIKTSITDNLEDGMYVMYRGTDWVFGNDASLEYAKLVNQGGSDHFTQSFTKTTETRKSSTTGLELSYKFLKFAVTQAYDITLSDSVTKSFTIDLTSPSGDTYYKIYLTYRRYDVLRVKNGQLSHSGSIYEFVGSRTVSKNVPAGQGGSIDTGSMVIHEDTCLLNPVNDSIWQIIDSREESNNLVVGKQGNSIFNLNANMSFNTFTYNSPSCNELYFVFNINEAGNYVFLSGKIVNLDLYKLNVTSRDQITKITSSKANNSSDTYIQQSLQGGNYVIKLSTNNDISNNYNLLIQKQ